MQPQRSVSGRNLAIAAACLLLPALAICAVYTGRPDTEIDTGIALLSVVLLAQIVVSIVAIVYTGRGYGRRTNGVGLVLLAVFALLAGLGSWIVGVLWILLANGNGGFALGGAWGRPLRVRGKQLHPSLTRGSDWTKGARPSAAGLDEETRRALEALWLHDAQKEHASVPAFSRVSWLLAAAGGPADLMRWSHRAAIEEIEHTEACFALAAGYGGRSFTVEPMPDLVVGGLDATADPRITLAVESLSDGCQLEDYNADVAAACAEACTEPVTRSVLQTIAREERTHAELSWAILAWCVDRHRGVVEAALAEATVALDTYPRPTAVAADKLALVARANPALLRAHGRLPDGVWAALWETRKSLTRARLAALLDVRAAA